MYLKKKQQNHILALKKGHFRLGKIFWSNKMQQRFLGQIEIKLKDIVFCNSNLYPV